MASLFELEAVVDSFGPSGTVNGISSYNYLSAAIADQRLGILMIDGGLDASPVTISETDHTQHIQGVSADLSVLGVNLTISRDNVTIDHLGLNGSILNLNALSNTVSDFYVTGASRITHSSTNKGQTAIVDSRFYDVSSASFAVAVEKQSFVQRNRFQQAITGPTSAMELSGISSMAIGNIIASTVTSGYSDYAFHVGAAETITAFNILRNLDKGDVFISSQETLTIGNIFMHDLTSPDSGRSMLRINTNGDATAGVIGNYFFGLSSSSDIAIEFTGAAGDAQGIIVSSNMFIFSRLELWQDAVLVGNMMRGCTVDLNSASGIYILGGDVTGGSLVGVASDAFIWGLKGRTNQVPNDVLFGSDLTIGGTLRDGYGLDVENATSLTALTVDNIRMGINGGAPYLILEEAGAAVQWGILNSLSALGFQNLAAGGPTFYMSDAGGAVAVQNTLGNVAFTVTSVASNDDPMLQVRQAKVLTTDATQTTLTGATVTIPASTTVQVLAFVQARRTGGSAGTAEDGASYLICATFKNVAGTATQIGTTTVLDTQESQVGWDAIFDVTGATARVRVTGATNNNVSWGATVMILPMGV